MAAWLFLGVALVFGALWPRVRWAAVALAAYTGGAHALDVAGVTADAASQAAWSGGALLIATAVAALATAWLPPEGAVVAYAVEVAARSFAAALLAAAVLAPLPGVPPRGDAFLLTFLGAYLLALSVETVRATRDVNPGAARASNKG